VRIGVSCFGHKLGLTGGAHIYRRELIKALASFDHSSHYVLLKWDSDELPLEDLPSNFTTVEFPSPGKSRAYRFEQAAINYFFRDRPNALSRQIDGLGLDVIHFPTTVIYPSNITTPSVLTFFDMQQEFYPENFSFAERVKRHLIYRPSAQKAAAIISPSSFTADTLIQRYGIAANKIRRIPVGISNYYKPQADLQALAAIRQKYGLPEEFIVYPANRWPHKNHRRLLMALAFLHKNHGLRINLVCTGAKLNNQEPLTRVGRSVGLSEQQFFDIGFVDMPDMPTIYNLAKLMVFPSLFEGFGIPMLEAMACGCPVVCANTTSLPEVGGEAVRFFDPLDVPAMAECIRQVWDDAKLRNEMIQKGLGRAQQFKWEQIIPELINVYRETAQTFT